MIFEDPWLSGAIDEATQEAILHALGDVIRRTRKARGMSLGDLAAQCGVSESVLCRIELSRRFPSVAFLTRASVELAVRPSVFLRAAENAAVPLPWQADRDPPLRSGRGAFG